ncbi:MAG: heavy metal translocating P-type ATPase metal-binding domain-containing protein [Bacteroidetes bacterium]|nr:heavy metal translocating P-type ATPase metal-binding domain-containing protein [Bacteroidota bacterium]
MEKTACVHCGADCGSSPVIHDDKPFCCHGCKTVYALLSEKDLGQYYAIQPMSGIKLGQVQSLSKFAFLDHDEINESLLDFRDGTSARVTFFIPTIHCASCIWLLEHLDTLHKAVTFSSVNFPKKEVHITFRTDQISLRQLAELLAAIHYVPEITLDQLDKKSPAKTNRSLLLKIGIAAFSFLNIMMYSFPEYLPGGDLLEQEFRYVFGWLSFLLILPVVFFSANDYYLSAWKGLKHKIISIDLPISLGIIALFLQSSWVVFSGNGIGYMDSLAGLIFFLLIGKWYQGKTYQALSFDRDYKSYFPVAITRIGNGSENIVPIKDLKTGDHILVRNQELIPADARIVRGQGNIDYSFVTGESMPVAKATGDFIYAGGRQAGSSIELVIEHAVEQSYLTQLWNQQSTKQDASRLKNHVNNVSHYFTISILVIASAAFAYWATIDVGKAVFVFTSVLIIACPCALALTVPFTFGSTMRVFGHKGFYLKSTDVIEQLHNINTIVFDKTGTITMNREVEVRFHGNPLTEAENSLVRSLVRHSGHPLSVILNERLLDSPAYEPDSFEEIHGMGITGVVLNTRVNIGSKRFVTGEAAEETRNDSRVYISFSNRQAGYFTIENVYREGLADNIQQLKKIASLHLISGDNDAEAAKLSQVFGEGSKLLFNQTPTDKKAYIEKLKAEGKKVLMIGDGLNDAGALASSKVGISVADDVFSFSPACDAIMESVRFRDLGKFIVFTHKSFTIIWISFAISLSYNIAGLGFAITGQLSPLIAAILMPLSSISVVAFASISVKLLSKYAL